MIYILIYFVIGFYLSEFCGIEDNFNKVTIFITWPIIVGGFLIVGTMFIVFGVINILIRLICSLFNNKEA